MKHSFRPNVNDVTIESDMLPSNLCTKHIILQPTIVLLSCCTYNILKHKTGSNIVHLCVIYFVLEILDVLTTGFLIFAMRSHLTLFIAVGNVWVASSCIPQHFSTEINCKYIQITGTRKCNICAHPVFMRNVYTLAKVVTASSEAMNCVTSRALYSVNIAL